ncbi:hypothetical protein ASPWEDRAFT_48280 [Aspergillus wentii DTO 134E9]|uniref:Inositolphosphotransferase Aur1/Ipt1 domain-containing protein n=1 Tax=Aspergillus wentii DTO 134E9 TaxID=1073089 RepID=A0A1L9S3N9_ASPWE|nr:uncharacterized protein ASPWEDRAFT_48280 [Aspergillus wentii DTO 134E9]OJJ41779.1 hypothetical protein ASPWEDRAFT_48280 [Aspergillus wentii DTO 134E9]
MGKVKNILEPLAIVLVFTVGTLINRRKSSNKLRLPIGPETPLLREETRESDASEDSNREARTESRLTIQSRFLAYFPFLIEIWYWLLTYWIYQGLRAVSARAIDGHTAIFDGAQQHAIQILSVERFLHIDIELSVQRFVLNRAPWLMDILAQIYYSHIALGVVFLVYCYTCLPRGQYQGIRRTLALENAIAFVIFTAWRCSPPRLLPKEYGFVDVLHDNKSGSSWTHNKFQLTIAAMPSLHFGNSLFIAFCLIRFSPHRILKVIAPLWPMMMLTTIVATANHFILDAVVGACVIAVAYRLNRFILILLPVERVLFKVLCLKKPEEIHEDCHPE